MAKQVKQLYRSSDNKIIAGVCGGLAEYFGWDPTIVRVLFVVLLWPNGLALFIYLLLAIVIPAKNDLVDPRRSVQQMAQGLKQTVRQVKLGSSRNVLAIFLVMVGLILLIRNFVPGYLNWFNLSVAFYLLIIGLGFYIILKKK